MPDRKKLVILTGAGISQESGIETFRGNDGLWENHRITEVATPDAFERDPELVLNFYNYRRKNVREAKPNPAHSICVRLEKHFDVHIVTQNIDDLHERAGSSKVLHLHGCIEQARSVNNDQVLIELKGKDIHLGDLAEDGGQLRPHVVWFGENVPEIENAARLVAEADLLLIVGTSLKVYPAAGLMDFYNRELPIYLIDPMDLDISTNKRIKHIKEKASLGMLHFYEELV
jgi:NAD-dependent deacetylase